MLHPKVCCKYQATQFVITCCIALLGFVYTAHAKPSTELIDKLRQGGYVIYFRHGATTYPGVDRLEWPRHKQRLLSELGEQQSRMIGKAFEALQIPVGEVLASPFARCRDMADIAFGRVQEDMRLIGVLSDRKERQERIQYLQSKFKQAPKNGKNRVIVSHTSNVRSVADVYLQEGDAVVIKPSVNGFEVLKIISPEQWRNAATGDAKSAANSTAKPKQARQNFKKSSKN